MNFLNSQQLAFILEIKKEDARAMMCNAWCKEKQIENKAEWNDTGKKIIDPYPTAMPIEFLSKHLILPTLASQFKGESEKTPPLGWTTDKDVLNQQREYWGAINGMKELREQNAKLTEALKIAAPYVDEKFYGQGESAVNPDYEKITNLFPLLKTLNY